MTKITSRVKSELFWAVKELPNPYSSLQLPPVCKREPLFSPFLDKAHSNPQQQRPTVTKCHTLVVLKT